MKQEFTWNHKPLDIQWLYKKLDELESKVNALQNQSESKTITELSDEEISKAIHKYHIIDFGQMAAFQCGAKWYREQLKSKQ